MQNPYAIYVGGARSTAIIRSLVDGVSLAKAAAMVRPGIEHTVKINGVDYARYTMIDGQMRSWVR